MNQINSFSTFWMINNFKNICFKSVYSPYSEHFLFWQLKDSNLDFKKERNHFIYKNVIFFAILFLPAQVFLVHLVYFQIIVQEVVILLDVIKNDKLQLHQVMQDVQDNVLYII